jgi:hypothetical protein
LSIAFRYKSVELFLADTFCISLYCAFVRLLRFFDPRCDLTDPLVWQHDVGRDLRVYFRHDTYQNKLLVVLVGKKSSQESDYRRLRKGQAKFAPKWGTA